MVPQQILPVCPQPANQTFCFSLEDFFLYLLLQKYLDYPPTLLHSFDAIDPSVSHLFQIYCQRLCSASPHPARGWKKSSAQRSAGESVYINHKGLEDLFILWGAASMQERCDIICHHKMRSFGNCRWKVARC